MLIDSSARIPEQVPIFGPPLSQVPEDQSPTYVDSEYPILNIVIQVVGSRGTYESSDLSIFEETKCSNRRCPTLCRFGERTSTFWPQDPSCHS